MTIWILAILLMTAVALAGWRQGAIRAAFSFVGIVLAALLAGPLGRLVHPLLPHLGASNPVTAWALAPVFGFILGSIPLKVAGQSVHHKVEHFYKYQAGDLRLALWTRLNARLGICVGLMNGAAYFILISFFIFNLAYWTTQMAASPNQSLLVRLMNSLGNDLQATGFSKTASAAACVLQTGGCLRFAGAESATGPAGGELSGADLGMGTRRHARAGDGSRADERAGSRRVTRRNYE